MSYSILDTIAAELGPQALAQLGSSVGATPQQTQAAVAAAIPALIGGLARNTASSEGAQSLAHALERDHVPNLEAQLQALGGLGGGSGGLLGGLVGALTGGSRPAASGGGGGLGDLLGAAMSAMTAGQRPSNAPKALDGAGILEHILGRRRGAVESGMAQASGLDMSVVGKLLPALAPILMSALGTIKSQRNLGPGGLSQVIQKEQESMSSSMGGKSLTSMLDLDNDGSVMDEVASMGGMLARSGMLGQLFR